MSTPEPNAAPRRLPWYVRLWDLPADLLARRLPSQTTEYTPDELGPLPDHFVDPDDNGAPTGPAAESQPGAAED